jgi:hypothetical protein
MEDFPAPVRPTIPIFCPAIAVKLTSFNTLGNPSLYFADTLQSYIVGFYGQLKFNYSPTTYVLISAWRPISES